MTTVTSARAQTIEIVGSRALGMGGAFVAVASDSSATWWNPGGLAAGPFLDMALARALTESRAGDATAGLERPAHRDTASWFALGGPPFAISYYRLRISDIRPIASLAGGAGQPTVTESGSREIETAVRSLSASQLGVTVVQTLIPGVHAGATLKYLRGTVRSGREGGAPSAGALLDRADALEGGEADHAFDVDLGVIAVGGPLRVGLLVKNAAEPEFENDAGESQASEPDAVRFERQFRVGFAYDARAGGAAAWIVALDADLTTTDAATGERRNLAAGVERWLWNDRLGVRGGARFNTAGAKDRAATGGVSVAVRAGLFLDAHAVRGGRDDDRGWGVAARVSF